MDVFRDPRRINDLDFWVEVFPAERPIMSTPIWADTKPVSLFNVSVVYGLEELYCMKLPNGTWESYRRPIAEVLIGDSIHYGVNPEWEQCVIEANRLMDDFDSFIFRVCGTGPDARTNYRRFLNDIDSYKTWAMQKILTEEGYGRTYTLLSTRADSS